MIPEKIEQSAAKAQEASLQIANLSEEIKNSALENIENTLQNRKEEILAQNAVDVAEAEKNGISKTLLKRLILNEDKLHDMIKNVRVKDLFDILDSDEKDFSKVYQDGDKNDFLVYYVFPFSLIHQLTSE